MNDSSDLLITTAAGVYCPAGDFFIDPWRPVKKAIITHAHADHASAGSERYLCATPGARVLQTRLGPEATIESVDYGQDVSVGSVRVTLFPAGHVLGSSQVRIEDRGEVWVISGDYKTAADPTCTPFEPVTCHVFVTESTFGLPIYRWPEQSIVFDDVNQWWRKNADDSRVSLIFAYSLGKAQRLLAGIDPTIGPIFCHGAIERLNDDYRQCGVQLPPTTYAGHFDIRRKEDQRALIVAPPSARATPWLRRFGDFASGFASGWMQIRGARRRRAVERGFVLSDHADWPGLLRAIHATSAKRILVTHGNVGPMVRWLNENGWNAAALPTHFQGEQDEVAEADAGEEPAT